MRNSKLNLVKNFSAVVALAIGLPFLCQAEVAPVWTKFVEAKMNSQRLPLPDFSYAGYARGEKGIPSPNWPIFDITNYGAIANDNGSDLDAVNAAIAAAQKSGSGIVFFPKGRYLLSEKKNITSPIIKIRGGNLILRGEGDGAGGTELYFREHLNSTTPEKKWTTPPMMEFFGSGSGSSGNFVTTVTSSAQLGGFSFNVKDASKLKANDFVIINLKDPAAANDQALAPYKVEGPMSNFKKGEFAREYHQIEKIEGSLVTLKEPLHMDIDSQYNWEVRSTALGENFGFEDIALVGGWKEKFKHHQDIIHDSGWTAIRFNKYYNSWFKNVSFKDWNSTLNILSSLSVSVINVSMGGNRGHSAVHISNSYGVLHTHSHSVGQGQFHEQGVSGLSAGIVFHRNTWPKDTSFDAHGSFPHATLFDRVDGGFSGASGGGGGAESAQPNHMRDLVFWNFKDLGDKSNIENIWWRTTKYKRYLPPKLAGWHGALPKFPAEQLALNESFGKKVEPESLYEAQLELRLGRIPNWLNELNGNDPAPEPENQKPTVSFELLSASYPFGSSLLPIVNASDSDGSIAKVELFLNDIFIREEISAPYEWGHLADEDAQLKSMKSGNYILKAVATDDQTAAASVEHAFTIEPEVVEPISVSASNSALSASVFKPSNNPAVVLSFALNSSSADATLDELTIQASGMLDEVNDLSGVGLYHDANNNGIAESGEKIGSGMYLSDNGDLTLSVDSPLGLMNGATPILVTYDFQ